MSLHQRRVLGLLWKSRTKNEAKSVEGKQQNKQEPKNKMMAVKKKERRPSWWHHDAGIFSGSRIPSMKRAFCGQNWIQNKIFCKIFLKFWKYSGNYVRIFYIANISQLGIILGTKKCRIHFMDPEKTFKNSNLDPFSGSMKGTKNIAPENLTGKATMSDAYFSN